MQNIKKLAVFVFALCVTMPLFALKIKDHPASQKAQAQLEADILAYLKNGQYQQIEKMIDRIYKCLAIQDKVFKKGQAPYRCRYTYDTAYRARLGDVHTVRIEGGSKQEIAVLDEYGALEKALNKHFAYPKKAGYLDYNKFVAVYKQCTGLDWLNENMRYFLSRNITSARKSGKVPFDKLAIVAKLSPDGYISWGEELFSLDNCGVHWDGFMDAKKCFPYKKSDVDRWYGEAINIYHDRAMFRQVKWKLFEAGILVPGHVYPSTDPDFWKNFAIQPPFTQTMKQQKQARIEKLIREIYNECKADSRNKNCYNIKTNAQKYGFWKETAAERQQRMTAEMRGHIATQSKK